MGVGSYTDERVESLLNAGVDTVVVDTAHGHSKLVLDRVRQIKSSYSDTQVIAGNIATARAAIDLVEAGVDAYTKPIPTV